MQFTIGWWFFFDACLLSARATPPLDAPFDTVPVRVAFPDWLSPIFSTFGMIIVNLIDKQRLMTEGGFSSSDSVAWKARLFLFLGFALMAGGLAGSITTLLLKYVLPAYADQWSFVKWWGLANVLQSSLTMLRWAELLILYDNADPNTLQRHHIVDGSVHRV